MNSLYAAKEQKIAGYLLSQTNDLEKHNDVIIYTYGSISLGRHPTCNELFNNDSISGFHCKIYVVQFDPSSAPMVYCQDTSLNGTYLNGQLIGRRRTVLLSNRDCISLCNASDFVFVENPAYKANQTELPDVVDNTVGEFQISNRVIGRGAFGEVLLAYTNTGEHIACKVSRPTSKKGFQPLAEVSILKKLSHPNIISIRDTFFLNGRVFIFEDLLTGGDLFSYLIGPNDTMRALPEAEVLFISYQILQALCYLHSNCIAHRDLKLDNILMESPFPGSRIVLGDFGIAKSLSGNRSKTSTVIGTPEYSAPEVGFSKMGVNEGYGVLCDMWSFGVITHILFTGISPFFEDSNVKQTAINARNGRIFFDSPEWDVVSSKGKDFVRQLLQVNPDSRLSSAQCFQHRWIKRFSPHLEEVYNEKVVKEWTVLR